MATFYKVRDAQRPVNMPEPSLWMTREEARAAVEAELSALNLTKPMTAEELDVFCKDVCERFNFALTKEDCQKLVLIWAEHWQALWL